MSFVHGARIAPKKGGWFRRRIRCGRGQHSHGLNECYPAGILSRKGAWEGAGRVRRRVTLGGDERMVEGLARRHLDRLTERREREEVLSDLVHLRHLGGCPPELRSMAANPRGFREPLSPEAVRWPLAALKFPSVPGSVREVSSRALELGARVRLAEERFPEVFPKGELAEFRSRIDGALLVLRYPQNRERLEALMNMHGIKCPSVPSGRSARVSMVEGLLRRLFGGSREEGVRS